MSALERRLAIALAISVALNLFVAGFFVARGVVHGGLVHERGGRHGHHHGPFLGPRALLDAGADAEPRVAALMKRHGTELRQERAGLRRARRAVHDALAAEPFDPGALERALAELRVHTGSSQARMHVALVELARELPLEQRKHLAKRAHVLDAAGPPHPHEH